MLLNGASDVQSGWGGKLQPSHPISSLNIILKKNLMPKCKQKIVSNGGERMLFEEQFA